MTNSYSALTTLGSKTAAEALAVQLEDLIPEPTGVGVFEIEDGSGIWEVGAYFIDPPDEIALALLAAAHDANAFAISEIPPTDWVAKVRRELAPVTAGRFFVYGSHDKDNVPSDCVPLLIEAAMAFGTGHHGTTLGCLRAIDRLAETEFSPHRIVDLGSGTAVLAMAANHIWPVETWASDIDPVATETAQANLVANGYDQRIRTLTCAGFDHQDLAKAGKFDLVLANILKGPLLALASEIGENLSTGGVTILSGILNTQAQEVVDTYSSNGFSLENHEEIGEWSTVVLRKSA